MNKNASSEEQNVAPTATELKKQMDKMLEHYLASNPVAKVNSQINELEVRFGTNPRKGKFISKAEYDNVIMKLLSCGFRCNNMEGTTMLRITPEYVDKITGVIKMSNIRAEIIGAELVQQYCRTNSIKKLADMPVNNDYKMKFTRKMPAQVGDGPNRRPIQKVVFADFNFNVSYNIEQDFPVDSKNVADMVRGWTENRKTFRLINRVRFYKDDSPIVVDLSIIRNSKMSGSVMVPAHTMEESGIFTNAEHCEIELEVDNAKVGVGTPYTKETVKALSDELRHTIRVILSGLQETNYPISYKEQDAVLQSYMKLVHGDMYEPRRITSRDFIGPSSLTLQLKNVIEPDANSLAPNIRRNYCVTDKADGDRKLLYISSGSGSEGKMYLINTNMFVQFTGCVASDKLTWNTLIDGEHIKYNNKKEYINTYAAFDAYYIGGKSVREFDFAPSDESSEGTGGSSSASGGAPDKQYRLPLLHQTVRMFKMISVLASQGASQPLDFKVNVKKFYPATGGKSIFDACNTVLMDVKDEVYPYATDGLIFTPLNTGVGGARTGQTSKLEKYTWPLSFKWKPPKYNTIDFLVTYKTDKSGKDEIHTQFEGGVNNTSRQDNHYRVLELRCGFDRKVHAYMNPFQDLIDDNIPAPKEMDNEETYKPMPFQPTNPYDAQAYIANIRMVKENDNLFMVTEEGERFEENTIVEFSYYPDRERGWRWSPLRVRHDKTYNLRAGNKEYGNAYHVANDNWKSIHHPVTEEMIVSGVGIPNADTTDDVYYNKSKDERISYTRALRNFHNLYVKRKLIEGVSKRGDTLIDYAVGKAGDMSKWKFANIKFVFGVDVSKDNIYNQNDGACARYLNERRNNSRMFDAIFLPGNSSANLRNGDAFFTDKERAIADAIFGKGSRDTTKMASAVYRHYGIGEKGFNVSSCQFALHYFFESGKTLDNFVRNLSECTQAGGYFIATCYDGKTVFDLLRKKEKGEGISIYVNDGADKIFEIQKMYDETGFSDDETSIGYPINVFQESINNYAMEYLVNYEFFRRSMENYGFTLATDEEARDFGFLRGSGMFDELFRAMKLETDKNPASRKWYENAVQMTEEEKRISFLNRYFIFKKAHNVNADKVSKIVALAEEEETKEIEKESSSERTVGSKGLLEKSNEETKPKAKVKRAKKIKSAEKVHLSDFVPIEEEEAEDEVPSAKVEEKAKVARCKDGTKKYKPLGEGCYTDAEIAAHKLNKTKKTTK